MSLELYFVKKKSVARNKRAGQWQLTVLSQCEQIPVVAGVKWADYLLIIGTGY